MQLQRIPALLRSLEPHLLVLRQTGCLSPQFPCLPSRQLQGLARPAQKTLLLATPVSEA
jgi:hypothetical protein